MSGNAVRLQAIKDVEAYTPPVVSFSGDEAPGEVFGANVFNKVVMQKRLPKQIYKSVIATIEQGKPLDPAVADAVASAMKDWALEKAPPTTRTSSTPDRSHGREARQLLRAGGRRIGARRVRGQDAHPG